MNKEKRNQYDREYYQKNKTRGRMINREKSLNTGNVNVSRKTIYSIEEMIINFSENQEGDSIFIQDYISHRKESVY